jgi:hypothetical protein
MIIWPAAAQHQLFARPACGEKRRVKIRSWHAGCADAADAERTVRTNRTHVFQRDMEASSGEIGL